jgi:internalin A
VRLSYKEAVRDRFDRRSPPPIGAGRLKVRDQLRQMLGEDQKREPNQRQHRLLERAEFDRICDKIGGVSDKNALLDFLHHNGVLFYRTGLFADRIVLDQNWALEAIYAIFDREKILPLLRGYGRFSRKDLEALIWSGKTTDKLKYTPAEQEVFLSMMESCGICFKVRELPNHEWEYIAPELLPNGRACKNSYSVGLAMILRMQRLMHATPFSMKASCEVISPKSASVPKTQPFTGGTVAGSTSRKHAARS